MSFALWIDEVQSGQLGLTTSTSVTTTRRDDAYRRSLSVLVNETREPPRTQLVKDTSTFLLALRTGILDPSVVMWAGVVITWSSVRSQLYYSSVS